MKVNEIINEGSLWDLASRANRVRKQVSTASAKTAQQQATNVIRPNPARQPTPTVATTAPGKLPPNVKVLASNPIVLQVDKLKFELDDHNQWHPLNRPTVDVSAGQAAILNKYLQLL